MDMSCVQWRKSSYSGTNGGACVEVSTHEVAGRRLVRDSRHPQGAVLAVASQPWQAFITSVKAGDFSLS
jgi:hypothetical protein